MNNFVGMHDADCLIAQARLAIRDIQHDGNMLDVSAALAAVLRCATAYGWSANTCTDLIFKAWGKRDKACATVRRRRRRIQTGLAKLVISAFDLEADVKAIEFKARDASPDLHACVSIPDEAEV